MKAAFCEINGIATRYLWAQDGDDRPPLLLLHGIGLSADSWCRNVDALSDGRMVVAADMLGHGFTDPVRPRGRTALRRHSTTPDRTDRTSRLGTIQHRG